MAQIHFYGSSSKEACSSVIVEGLIEKEDDFSPIPFHPDTPADFGINTFWPPIKGLSIEKQIGLFSYVVFKKQNSLK
jgi:hypothetical protein